MLHFSEIFIKKTYEGTPIESPIILFYWKYAPFFHILNDNIHMMLLFRQCVVFEYLIKRKSVEQAGSVFF